MTGALLIRDAELLDDGVVDVLVERGRIVAIGSDLEGRAGQVIDARGGLLLPGLHDHHIHVTALAAGLASVRCGPPEVADGDALAAVLGAPGTGWLRGVGYHESVAGLLDRRDIDRLCLDRPVRIQHRSGRLWMFNSLGLERLLASGVTPPDGLEREAGGFTGRLYDQDAWARRALGGSLPDLAPAGMALARLGITGITEISPANDDLVADHYAAEHRRSALPQRVLMAGRLGLGSRPLDPAIVLGPVKLHLHEADLPAFDEAVAMVQAGHAAGRVVAVHCTTAVELSFTLAVLREATVRTGDRIEHASVASDAMVAEIAALGLAVVVQPNFVLERGDSYLQTVAPEDIPILYRLQAFAAAGVTLAGGSDAPFGQPDPWAAMGAAVSRRTRAGRVMDAAEALSPRDAVALFLADPVRFDRQRRIAIGARADCCLLEQSWSALRADLAAASVRATLIDGVIVHAGDDR